MLLYILLILGQAFASQKMADSIYFCTSTFARHEAARSSSNKTTVREVVEACKDQVGASSIFIKEAKITEGSTHYIKLAWQEKGKEQFRHYAFNVPNTKLCNETKIGNVGSTVFDLREIMKKTENSREANYCTMDKTKRGTSIFGGFGFVKTAKGCKRKCHENEVLVAKSVPILYQTTENISDLLTAGDGIQYLSTHCVRCPKSPSNRFTEYTQTYSQNNLCYDMHGCEEGFEYVAGVDEKNHPFTVPSVSDPKKVCVAKCSQAQRRASDGSCQHDAAKACEREKKKLVRLDEWLLKFMKLSKTHKLGTCDMDKVREEAQKWVKDHSSNIEKIIKSGCTPESLEDYAPGLIWKFSSHLVIDARGFDVTSCAIDPSGNNTKYDPEIYNLISEVYIHDEPQNMIYN